MRPRFLAIAIALALIVTPSSQGAEPPQLSDAPLHAVQFVDDQEGWAVGDEGVIWHTIDGGQSWERQSTGVRASLRGMHFLDPFTGYVVGTEQLPRGGGSAGVILYTRDGGVKWQRASAKELPGLYRVKFFDRRVGLVVGASSDQHPTGLFATEDSGVNWKPVTGERSPGWFAADFLDPATGVLGGPWGSLAPVRRKEFVPVEGKAELRIGQRAVRAIQLQGRSAWAVGEGGLVLRSDDTAGKKWGHAEVQLPREVQSCWDFHAVHFVGDRGWIVGRPGSVVLHTWDRGKNWQVQNTGQTLPLHGIHFADEQHGWAVGEMGTIVATNDGGKTWKVQRRGGHRAAVLVISGQSSHLPLGTVTLLGGDEGYLVAACQVAAADAACGRPARAMEGACLQEGIRSAGGCGGEVIWQFPFPQHLATASATDLARAWANSQDEARGYEELIRQLVLAMRTWKPDVVITDNPDPRADSGSLGAVVALAANKAFELAGKADAFPEQLAKLDLQPWNPSKLYGRWESPAGAEVVHDLNAARSYLQTSVLDYSAAAWDLLNEEDAPRPAQECFHLLASRVDGAAKHRHMMDGLSLNRGGQARRLGDPMEADDAQVQQIVRSIQQRRDFNAIALQSLQNPTKAGQMLAAVEQGLRGLSEDQAGEAAYGLGRLYARSGQWLMAKEVFLLMLDRYPAHRLAPDACRWLIQYGSSSEARRRDELKQFHATALYTFAAPAEPLTPGAEKLPQRNYLRGRRETVLMRRLEEIREWYKSAVALSDVLTAYGPLYSADPTVQFPLQSAHRALGEFDKAQLWYTQLKLNQSNGPWVEAASSELWLNNRAGQPAKPLALCGQAAVPPYLDGHLDDPCWKDARPFKLKDAVGQTAENYAAEARLAYDANFLYLALRCQHPENGHQVAPVKPRPRDADLRAFDRVSLYLDLDRDYATYFHLQVDQRGCVYEDCWGDPSWNPKWYVAVHSEAGYWQIEAAIPLVELTGEPIRTSQAWAFNLVRTIPGRGVQGFSVPADVSFRPEGMGLLQFRGGEESKTMPAPQSTTAKDGR